MDFYSALLPHASVLTKADILTYHAPGNLDYQSGCRNPGLRQTVSLFNAAPTPGISFLADQFPFSPSFMV